LIVHCVAPAARGSDFLNRIGPPSLRPPRACHWSVSGSSHSRRWRRKRAVISPARLGWYGQSKDEDEEDEGGNTYGVVKAFTGLKSPAFRKREFGKVERKLLTMPRCSSDLFSEVNVAGGINAY